MTADDVTKSINHDLGQGWAISGPRKHAEKNLQLSNFLEHVTVNVRAEAKLNRDLFLFPS